MSRRLPAWQKMASHHSHLVHQFLSQTPSWEHLFHLPGRQSYNCDLRFKAPVKVPIEESRPRNRCGDNRPLAKPQEAQKARGSPHQRILAQNNLTPQQGSEKPTYSRKRLADLATPKRKFFPPQKISPSNFGEVLKRSIRSTIGEASSKSYERYLQVAPKKPFKFNNLGSSSKKSAQRNLDDLFGDLDSRSSNSYTVASDRLVELAKSKKSEEPVPSEPWKLTKAMRDFQPTQRLLDLAHKPSFTKERHPPFQINWSTLHYKASSRTSQLAKATKKIPSDCLMSPTFKSEVREPTERLIELAKPKLRKDTWTRTAPYQVPSRALKAKITPRLIELARPRL
ncbi:uncharacterized protein Dana_GF16954, isoform B [Drosophila ananassae]|uniref:Uncharacterized protein, isoform B n=1 Tax=Drosophila ananassae TaxID=7217 RepID=B3LVK5_DROAN|nr:uncharacterized protein LOC6499745 isoform X2 [Drosophila ananassae]EDV42575.2 uncharacterized protein Dana_GF16954, isoform B [Drosophila ananassae]